MFAWDFPYLVISQAKIKEQKASKNTTKDSKGFGSTYKINILIF